MIYLVDCDGYFSSLFETDKIIGTRIFSHVTPFSYDILKAKFPTGMLNFKSNSLETTCKMTIKVEVINDIKKEFDRHIRKTIELDEKTYEENLLHYLNSLKTLDVRFSIVWGLGGLGSSWNSYVLTEVKFSKLRQNFDEFGHHYSTQ